jgi:hypothetical protein
MSFDTLIQAWLIAVSGYDDQHVIRANPEGPKPEGNHITYLLLTSPQSDFAEVKKTDLESDDDIQVDYTHAAKPAYSINVYAQDGEDIINDLWDSRYLLIPRKILRTGGLVLAGRSGPGAVPQPGDTTWLPQYAKTFEFRGYHVSSEVNQKILQWVLSGEFGDLDASITVP